MTMLVNVKVLTLVAMETFKVKVHTLVAMETIKVQCMDMVILSWNIGLLEPSLVTLEYVLFVPVTN